MHSYSEAKAAPRARRSWPAGPATGRAIPLSVALPIHTVTALRLTLLVESAEARAALTLALFRAAWADDEDINDPAVLEHVRRPPTCRPACLAGSASPRSKRRCVATPPRPRPGASLACPASWCPDRRARRSFFFGQDRLPFVQGCLARSAGSALVANGEDAGAWLACRLPTCCRASTSCSSTAATRRGRTLNPDASLV